MRCEYWLHIYILACLAALPLVLGWREWTWKNSTGPGTRRGHSLNVYGTQLIVFGGRTEDSTKIHSPKSYETYEVNGSIEFIAYEANATEPFEVPVAVLFNDVWSYDINCTRYADEACVDKTWVQLREGADWGGCRIVFGAHVCSHPSERWYHRAEVFDDNTMIVYGGFSPSCSDYCDDMWLFDFTDNSWTELMEIGNSFLQPSPGKRFKFSSVVLGQLMYIFGGYRLWQGFTHENSVENDWSDYSRKPLGGYLNDLWEYNKSSNSWRNLTETLECPDIAATATIEDIEVECIVTWPPARAGHASTVYEGAIYIHGGYRTFFPYPTTTGRGAGRGTLTEIGAGFTPYPTYPYYLDDMWKYNLSTRVWEKVVLNEERDTRKEKMPLARMDHSLVAAREVLILFGGYVSNFYFSDTWIYNITSNRWVKEKTFVYPIYPSECTDDLEHRKLEHSGDYSEFVLPSDFVHYEEDEFYFSKELHYGTLKFSVYADPTRGTFDTPTFVNQARRQAPGWDGCRHRNDSREDLDDELQWMRPSQRAGHQAVYHEGYDKVFIYGGYGYDIEQSRRVDTTFSACSLGDLWQLDLDNCPKNCSRHGLCHFGNCRCNDGYYGVDCSNSTCPGTYCYYDEIEPIQHCDHCCFSGFEHLPNNDSYVENLQKFPCTSANLHYSNGICDGFGMCICKPSFVGDDCSIRDCGKNCSGHGYCSEEFPNARCLCDEGWFGQYCELQMCVNNCSYPNGVCLNGSCYCSMVYEPYNNTLEYFPLMGEDCSFLIPFAGVPMAAKLSFVVASISIFITLVVL